MSKHHHIHCFFSAKTQTNKHAYECVLSLKRIFTDSYKNSSNTWDHQLLTIKCYQQTNSITPGIIMRHNFTLWSRVRSLRITGLHGNLRVQWPINVLLKSCKQAIYQLYLDFIYSPLRISDLQIIIFHLIGMAQTSSNSYMPLN